MAVLRRRFSGPHQRDYEIVVSETEDGSGTAMATCIDVASGRVIGCRYIQRGQEPRSDDIERLAGGALRLASFVVDLDTKELGKLNREMGEILRLRERFWHTYNRVRVRHLERDAAEG